MKNPDILAIVVSSRGSRWRHLLSRCLVVFTAAILFAHANAAAAQGTQSTNAVQFLVIGDMPYGNRGEKEYEEILKDLKVQVTTGGTSDPSFVIHLGDFQRSGSVCKNSDNPSTFYQIKASEIYGYGPSTLPVFYTPGDNDWMDCNAGISESTALLELRAAFFEPDRTDIPGDWYYCTQDNDNCKPSFEFKRECDLAENARWMVDNILFATVHLVSTKNGRIDINPETDCDEARLTAAAREQAAKDWIKETVAYAKSKGVDALVIAMHADPDRKDYGNVFDDFLKTLNKEVSGLDGTNGSKAVPTLLVHGDTTGTYLCKVNDDRCVGTIGEVCVGDYYTPVPDKRLSAVNLWRLNAMGDYQWDALVVDVDPTAEEPFSATRFREPYGQVTDCQID